MGSAERRTRHKQELRRKILDAARAIIVEDGFSALTMRRIAEKIDYSPAAIYLHFTDRDEIARVLSQEGFEQLLKCLEPASAIAEPWPRMRSIANAYVSFGVNNGETYKLILMDDAKYIAAVFSNKENASGQDPATASFQILLQAAEDIKKAGITNSALEPLELTETIWTALHGIVSLKLTCSDFLRSSAERLTEIMLEGMEQGLRPARISGKGTAKRK
jgi:AcrR family transcriptional regulator